MRSCCRPQPGTVFVAVLHLVCLLSVTSLWAQEDVAIRGASPSLTELQTKAARISESYGQLEQLILRMAEIETLTNPERAALLKRAAQQSAERRTRKQLDDTITLLAPPAKLKLAIDEQERGLADLKSLLELLLSENRADRLKAEETRIREYIKEVERLIRLQRSAEGRTRGGADPQKLADEQERLAARTGELAEDLRRTEEGGQSADENSAELKPAEAGDESPPSAKPEPAGDPSPGKPEEQPEKDASAGEPGNEKKPAGSGNQPQDKPGTPAKESGGEDKQPGGDSKAEGQPQEGKSQEGKPAEGQPQEGSPSSESSPSSPSDDQPPSSEKPNPARQRLQAAEQRMREAQKRLEEAKRDAAVDEQEKARHELEQAKAELEEILRQLRQEEVGRTLALLEGRFRRMLEKQVQIYEATQRLDKISPDARDRQVDIQASKLGFDETKLAIEADKALLLLHEEGSSVAFPETVELLRDDMQDVADRLAAANIGAITQGVEEEIIAALEEMIEALQQAQQDLEDKKQQQQQQQGQPREPGDEPLVDRIAELKMIRALQMRVNTRTTHYSRLLQDADDLIGQAEDQELRESLRKLSERQERIHEVTRDIVLGKNQ